MRPFFAILVVVTILGGMQAYMTYRPRPQAASAVIQETSARGSFSVEVTPSFDAGPDQFALELDDAPSLIVQFRGKEILSHRDAIDAGTAVTVDDVSGLVVGGNEFFVRATPATLNDISLAIRIRILRDGSPLADQTLWSEPGEAPQGTVVIDVPPWSQPEGEPVPDGERSIEAEVDPPVLEAGEIDE